MPRKIEIAALAVAIIGVVVALLTWLRPAPFFTHSTFSNAESQSVGTNRPAPSTTLKVSGTGAHVTIRVAGDDSWYEGGLISATNANSVVYMPIGQRLKLTITGTGSLVEIDSKLMPYVQVSNFGTGANVVEI